MTDLHQYDGGPSSDTAPGTGEAVKEEATQVASTAVDQGKQTATATADAAGQTASTAAEGAKQVASEAKQQATEVTRQATDQARELVGQAQGQLREQAATQTQRAAGGMADVGKQIRALSDGQPDQAGFAADAARQLAEKVEEIANRMEQRGFDGAVEDLSNFARRRPGMFLLSAAATGFVVGRLGRGAQVVKETQSSTPQAPTLPPALSAPQQPLVLEAPTIPASEPYLTPTTLPELDGGQ
jgi:hypothetical protein